MKNKNTKKELSRDILALGSWVFYILVIARALIQPYRPFVDQLIIAAIALLILNMFIKNSDNYTARALILAIFTSLFYQSTTFSAFALVILIGLIISSHHINNSKTTLAKGILAGIISSSIAYYIPTFY